MMGWPELLTLVLMVGFLLLAVLLIFVVMAARARGVRQPPGGPSLPSEREDLTTHPAPGNSPMERELADLDERQRELEQKAIEAELAEPPDAPRETSPEAAAPELPSSEPARPGAPRDDTAEGPKQA